MNHFILLCTNVVFVFTLGITTLFAETTTTSSSQNLFSENAEEVMEATITISQSKNKAQYKYIPDLINAFKHHQKSEEIVRLSILKSLAKMHKSKNRDLSNFLIDEGTNINNSNTIIYASILAIINVQDFDNPRILDLVSFTKDKKKDDPFIQAILLDLFNKLKASPFKNKIPGLMKYLQDNSTQ